MRDKNKLCRGYKNEKMERILLQIMIYYYFPFIRSAYDLSQHSKATGVRLCAEKKLAQPVTKQVTEVVPNKGPIGKAFKKVHY